MVGGDPADRTLVALLVEDFWERRQPPWQSRGRSGGVPPHGCCYCWHKHLERWYRHCPVGCLVGTKILFMVATFNYCPCVAATSTTSRSRRCSCSYRMHTTPRRECHCRRSGCSTYSTIMHNPTAIIAILELIGERRRRPAAVADGVVLLILLIWLLLFLLLHDSDGKDAGRCFPSNLVQ